MASNSVGTLGVSVGWGYKPSAERAAQFAEQAGSETAFFRAEEGFYSYLSGDKTPWRLSYFLDQRGMYYNATEPSDLEAMLNSGCFGSDEFIDRAKSAMGMIRENGLTKYPTSLSVSESLRLFSDRFERVVLLADQTYGDLSVSLGQACAVDFEAMLANAKALMDEDETVGVIVKVHPDVLRGSKKGYLTEISTSERFYVCTDAVNPYKLFECVSDVWVVTSQLGFEALIAGKSVRCFGVPFYSGWGLTQDEKSTERRDRVCSLEELFAAACIEYPVYVNPFTEKVCELEDVLQLLISRQRIEQRYCRYEHAICVGFSFWKRCFLTVFLSKLFCDLSFVSKSEYALKRYGSLKNTPAKPVIVAWGKNALTLKQQQPEIPIVCLEDGFIRSAGLGTDLKKPSSLALDFSGLHFAGNAASDLSSFLMTSQLSSEDLCRSRALIDRILELNVTKYNLSGSVTDIQSRAGGKKVILIPGQVPGDASLFYGADRVSNNLMLIREVRKRCPDDYLVYKPHPDVVSGNRTDPDLNDMLAKEFVDLVVLQGSITHYIEQADEVHTMTSQAGFEALMRSKTVVCYGLPFYAGWGLTIDKVTRHASRRLSLEELVYGALVWYPLYFDWRLQELSSVESLVHTLGDAQKSCEQKVNGHWESLRRLMLKGRFLLEVLVFRVLK